MWGTVSSFDWIWMTLSNWNNYNQCWLTVLLWLNVYFSVCQYYMSVNRLSFIQTVSVFSPVCFSVYLSVIYHSLSMSVFQGLYLIVFLLICQSLNMFACTSVSLSLYYSFFQSVSQSIWLPVNVSLYLSLFLLSTF